jgi:glycosyltransferase involved in cell wall biosynthesis
MPERLCLRGPGGRRLRVAHLTTVDMSLALLLGTELVADREAALDVYGLSAPGPYVDRVAALGVTHVPIPSLTRRWDARSDVRAMRELARVIRRLDLDVLHTHTPKGGVFGRVVGRLTGVPVVVNTCHGLWVRGDDGVVKRTVVQAVEGGAARLSHAELFQNGEDARALRWALRRHDARVVGNGIDLTRFRFDAAGRQRIRAELGVGDDELLVGGVGRRTEEKGLRELSAAAVGLSGAARFVWVGPEDPATSGAIGGELTGVELLGERADMPAVYSAFDVFVLPSHREGFSRAAMEAAACGRPMVLTDIRGCREIGTDGEHLLLVAPKNPGALTEAIRRLLSDASLRDRIGAAAQARAQATFDQRAVAAVSLRTYADVARRKRLGWTLEAA